MSGETISVQVNGRLYTRSVDARLLLSDFLRHSLGLTGTHVGCEHGICGVCTIMVNGHSARSCLMFAVQTDGCSITTVEGLGTMDNMHIIQQAFQENHGLQCGFCTPGMLMTCVDILNRHPVQTDEEIRDGLSGNLCRCTGYQSIVESVRWARDRWPATDDASLINVRDVS